MSSRLEQATAAQQQTFKSVAIYSFVVACAVAFGYFDSEQFWPHLVVLMLSWYLVFTPWYHFAIRSVIHKIYGGDIKLMKSDANQLQKSLEEPETQEIELTIVEQSTTKLGVYKGVEYADWIIVKNVEGKFFKLQFIGIMDIDTGISQPLKPGEILLMPGFLYQLHSQVE